MLPLTIGDTDVPYWAERPEEDWALFEDFPTFLAEVWKHLGLPPPTRHAKPTKAGLHLRHDPCSFGIGEIKKPVQPVGEPSHHTSRRRAFVDAARGDQLTRRLALGERAAQLMRYLRPRLQNGRQVLLRQF